MTEKTPREALIALGRELGVDRAVEWVLASPWRWGPIFAIGIVGFVVSFAKTLPRLF